MALVFLLGAIVICTYSWLKHHFSTFQRLGIAGPTPSLLTGNLMEILKKGQLQAMIDWGQKYGRVFGYFEGWTPVIACSDPDILREILVKDFTNFRSRKPFPLAPKKALGLFLENGDQWKKSRSALTPAFSSGKLRQIFHIMNNTSDHLVRNIENCCKEDREFDIYSTYQCLTLDVIGRCAFGLQTNAQTDANDPFLRNIRTLFNYMTKTIIQPLVMMMPFLQSFIFALKNVVVLFGMNSVVWLRNQMREVIKIRKEMGANSSVVDLVQLMVFPTTNSKRKGAQGAMTDREIVAQSMTFLLAGYETTSAVLAYLTSVLARHEHVQQRLCNEIDEVIGDDDVTYENIQKLPFFDMVIDEVCRLYPTASLIVTRQAAESRVYNGVHIPAGMAVQANVWALHHDEQFWSKPEHFSPERFSPERKNSLHPFTFLPFGAGPRSCIGMRFALMETKIAVARILQNHWFSATEETKKPLTVLARGAIVPKDGVLLKVTKRLKP